MSLALLFHYLLLNMFRMLIHPSPGACDLFDELLHGLYGSVRIEVDALAYLFSGECLVVTCVVVSESVGFSKFEFRPIESFQCGGGGGMWFGQCGSSKRWTLF